MNTSFPTVVTPRIATRFLAAPSSRFSGSAHQHGPGCHHPEQKHDRVHRHDHHHAHAHAPSKHRPSGILNQLTQYAQNLLTWLREFCGGLYRDLFSRHNTGRRS